MQTKDDAKKGYFKVGEHITGVIRDFLPPPGEWKSIMNDHTSLDVLISHTKNDLIPWLYMGPQVEYGVYTDDYIPFLFIKFFEDGAVFDIPFPPVKYKNDQDTQDGWLANNSNIISLYLYDEESKLVTFGRSFTLDANTVRIIKNKVKLFNKSKKWYIPYPKESALTLEAMVNKTKFFTAKDVPGSMENINNPQEHPDFPHHLRQDKN